LLSWALTISLVIFRLNPDGQTGFHAAVNPSNRIHGYWVNTTDVLFYQGTTEKINSMIEALASIPDAETNIVIHAGSGVATSPWGGWSGRQFS
jgi:hypothetical protein